MLLVIVSIADLIGSKSLVVANYKYKFMYQLLFRLAPCRTSDARGWTINTMKERSRIYESIQAIYYLFFLFYQV